MVLPVGRRVAAEEERPVARARSRRPAGGERTRLWQRAYAAPAGSSFAWYDSSSTGSRRSPDIPGCSSETACWRAAAFRRARIRSPRLDSGKRTCSEESRASRMSASAPSSKARRVRRVAGDEPRTGRRREGNGRDELRIVAASVPAIGIRPRPVEDVLAVGVRLQIQRHRADQLVAAPGSDVVWSPARLRRGATRVVQRVQERVREQRTIPHQAIPGGRFDRGKRVDEAERNRMHAKPAARLSRLCAMAASSLSDAIGGAVPRAW